MASPPRKVCGKCRREFSLPAEAVVALACPYCRTPFGVSGAVRWNRNAATLAILSEAALVAAATMPFMSLTKLGRVETYSLVGGIVALRREGELVLAAVIGVFSLVFPHLKNLLLLAATTRAVPLSTARRRSLHAVAAKTAKYSMLDVFVAAVLVVVVKLGRNTEVAVRSGLFLFCGAIVLSMAASACVRFGDEP
jgi:paraquat-inducible protein A